MNVSSEDTEMSMGNNGIVCGQSGAIYSIIPIFLALSSSSGFFRISPLS